MITRRLMLAATLAALAVPTLAPPAHADATDAARDLVAKLGKQLTDVANGPGSADDRRAALEKLVDAAVDVEAVARFCLGRFWRTATPDQQRDYTKLFRAVLMRNITGKAGEYKGVVMDVGKAQAREDDVAVSSVVNRPGNAPNKVDWIVGTASGAPRVIDVIAEGTSLRLTQRSDYSAFLASHNNNVQALIDALKAQAAAAPG
jgi:phospholipid transport system substrate-binding protein